MELKHLIIAAIVANAAKSGRPAAPGSSPALTIAVPEDARPSYGAFASLTNCLESPPALCREDRKKTTSAVFHLLTRFFFAVPLPATVVSAHLGECFGNTCLGYVMAPARHPGWRKMQPVADSARGSTEFSGIRAGWRCTALGPCGTASPTAPVIGRRTDKVLNRRPCGVHGRSVDSSS